MEPLIILGAGTMAQEVTELVEESSSYQIIAYAVNQGWQEGQTLYGKPILNQEQLSEYIHKAMVIRAIFSPDCLDFIEIIKQMGFNFAKIIHPSASVAKSTQVYPGVVVNRLVAIGCHSDIGRHALINRGCTIGHHCLVKDGVTFGPGVNVAGNVTIGAGALIGMGANIIQKANIKPGQKIRAGSLIVR